MFHVLTPAYGRDYKSAKEVIADFDDGKDFVGDYSLQFQYVSKRDLAPGSSVQLRYNKLRNFAVTKV